jgi:tetratricopeptide (TPR) repeat protein
MTRLQLSILVGALFLFFGMYFGCDTKPQNTLNGGSTKSVATDNNAVDNVIQTAKAALTAEDASNVKQLEQQIQVAISDTAKASLMKKLAGFWYRAENATASGYYAEQIANIERKEEAWSIAGTTYLDAIKQNTAPEVRTWCSAQAVKMFEKATDANPSNINHKINMALCYVENPLQDNPMKGILMLRELDTQVPNQPTVQITLARLAIKTGQFEKAIARLEKAVALNPKNKAAICLLADAYQGIGNAAKEAEFGKKCQAK